MLNIDSIKNGLVIDHIRAGSGWRIFQWLGLDKSSFCSALIMNAPSKKTGKKDIIKIENVMDIDFSVLGFIDPNISVNVIQNVFKCKNPRCITATETYVKPTFLLVDKAKGLYRCEYCDTMYKAGEDGTVVEKS